MTSVDAVARATLYEAHLLYPDRPAAIGDRQRWTTGGLLPSAYCAQHREEASALRVECLVEGDAATALDVEVRFLQLVEGLASGSPHAVERRLAMPQQVIRDVLVHPVTLRAIFDGEPGARARLPGPTARPVWWLLPTMRESWSSAGAGRCGWRNCSVRAGAACRCAITAVAWKSRLARSSAGSRGPQ